MSDDSALKIYIEPDQLKQDLAFNTANLSEAMQHHAAMFWHYADLAVRARAQADRWKAGVEILESQLDHEHRTALKESNPKTTEAQIRAAVVNDTRWKAAQRRMLEAQTQYRLAESAERAFEHRKDMLLQVARNQVKEQEGAIRVSANQEIQKSARESLLAKMQQQSAQSAALITP